MKKMFLLLVCITVIVNISSADIIIYGPDGSALKMRSGTTITIGGTLAQGPPEPDPGSITKLCIQSEDKCVTIKVHLTNPTKIAECNCLPDTEAHKGIFLHDPVNPLGYSNVCVGSTGPTVTINPKLWFRLTTITETFNNFETFNAATN